MNVRIEWSARNEVVARKVGSKGRNDGAVWNERGEKRRYNRMVNSREKWERWRGAGEIIDQSSS